MEKWIEKLLNLTVEEVNEIDTWIYDSCVNEDDFIIFVQEQTKDLGKNVWELDFYSLLLEFVAMTADVPELIPTLYNHGNQVIFNISSSEAGKIMIQIPEEDRNESWFYLLGLIDAELPDNEM